jgi:hypothetical protein
MGARNERVHSVDGYVKAVHPNGFITVEVFDRDVPVVGMNGVVAHPKQCRKLKVRRRVWLADALHHQFVRVYTSPAEAAKHSDPDVPVVEFVEVRRKAVRP